MQSTKSPMRSYEPEMLEVIGKVAQLFDDEQKAIVVRYLYSKVYEAPDNFPLFCVAVVKVLQAAG